MSSSEEIVRQFSGVIPGMATGQNAVAKTYVDSELEKRDTDITNVAGSAAAAQSTIDLHKSSSTAHSSTAITYSGDISGASNVKQAIETVQQNLTNFINLPEAGLKDQSITTQKIRDLNITREKLSAGAVSSDKLADESVTKNKIVKDAVTQFSYDMAETDRRIGTAIAGGIPEPVIDEIKESIVSDVVSLGTQLSELSVNVKTLGAKGDGVTDDLQPIQAALDLVKANGGGEVWFPSGTYMLSWYVRVASNTTIRLSPKAVIKRASSVNLLITNDSDGSIGGYDASENITISGGMIDGNASAFPTACTPLGLGHAKNILIENVIFANTPIWHHIELNAVKDAVVRGCTFDNNTGAGTTESLQIDGMFGSSQFPWFGPYDNTMCSNITIDNCVFTNGVDGIGSHSSGTSDIHEFISIKNNSFYNFSGTAIKPLNYTKVLIEGNKIDTCWKGIDVRKDSTTPTIGDYVVQGNVLKNINVLDNGRAIAFTNIKDISVSQNIVKVVDRHGITFDFCANITVSENNVQGCYQSGIWANGCQNANINNNVVFGNNTSGAAIRYDLMIGYVSGTIASDCKVINNYCETVGAQYTDKLTITDNTIKTSNSITASTNTVSRNNFVAGSLNSPAVYAASGGNLVEQEGNVNVALVASGQTTVTVTFPVAFSGIPDVFPSLGGTGRFFVTASSTTSTQVTLYITNLDATTPTVVARWLAKGVM